MTDFRDKSKATPRTDAKAGQDDEGQDDDLHEFFGGACQRCNGEGLIVICPDDLCRADDWCMHGDGMATCPDCGGEG